MCSASPVVGFGNPRVNTRGVEKQGAGRRSARFGCGAGECSGSAQLLAAMGGKASKDAAEELRIPNSPTLHPSPERD